MLSVNHQILSLVLCANVNSNNLIIHLFKELGIDYLGGPVLHLYMAYALAIRMSKFCLVAIKDSMTNDLYTLNRG